MAQLRQGEALTEMLSHTEAQPAPVAFILEAHMGPNHDLNLKRAGAASQRPEEEQ